MRYSTRMRIPTNGTTNNKRTISTNVDVTENTVTYTAEIELPTGGKLSEEIERELISDLKEREKYYHQWLSERH